MIYITVFVSTMISAAEIFQNRCRLCLEDNGIDVQRMKYKDKMLELVSASSGIQVSIFYIGMDL